MSTWYPKQVLPAGVIQYLIYNNTKMVNKVKRTVERWVSENTKNLRTTYLSVAQRVVVFSVVCLYYTFTYLMPHIFDFFRPFFSLQKCPWKYQQRTS